MNKTAIVTGVTGQMGSFFAEFLLSQGITVIGVTRRLSVPNEENIKKIKDNEKIIFELMDLGDSHSINNIVEKYKPDYFINCAANSFVGTSWDCPEQHFEYNCLGVLRQLEAIRKHSPSTRYINFGSSEEFGDVVTVPQDENHPPRARSPYGASKIAARQIIKVYRESYSLYALQCWCFNYESERRGEEFVTRKITKGVARIQHAIKNGISFEPIKLGNLEAKRDWSYCVDFVDGVWKMLNQDANYLKGDFEDFNFRYQHDGQNERSKQRETQWLSKNIKEYVLSSDETHSIREFVELAFKSAGIEGIWIGEKLETLYALPNYLSDFAQLGSIKLVEIDEKFYRPCEVELLFGDSTKAREQLGWTPKCSFGDLVKKMVDSDVNDLKMSCG
jgi:GDPmannose 4,6-dehydratase